MDISDVTFTEKRLLYLKDKNKRDQKNMKILTLHCLSIILFCVKQLRLFISQILF